MADAHWTTATDRLLEIAHAPRFGVLSDFDGTLSPFRPDPETPHMTPRNAELLVALAARLPVVALISGRAALELQEIVKLPGIAYIGNHGLETLRDGEVVVVEEAQPWQERLDQFTHELGEPTIPGVHHRNKRVTMSITYRQSAQPDIVREQLREQLETVNQKYGFTLFEGRTIWEVKPPIDIHKGTALAALIDEHRLDSAIFLGDDYTDVAAFESLHALRQAGRVKALTVAVLAETDVPLVRETADVLANDVADVETLLAWLLDHLPPNAT